MHSFLNVPDYHRYHVPAGGVIRELRNVHGRVYLDVVKNPDTSVNLTPEVGAVVRKGDGLGYFQFGGSDIVMLFQDRDVVLEAEVGEKYPQGQRIGRVEW